MITALLADVRQSAFGIFKARRLMATSRATTDRFALVANEHWEPALRLASKSKTLGKYRDAIQKAWSALQRPDFYRDLGQDPDALVAAGIEALKQRYSEQ